MKIAIVVCFAFFLGFLAFAGEKDTAPPPCSNKKQRRVICKEVDGTTVASFCWRGMMSERSKKKLCKNPGSQVNDIEPLEKEEEKDK